jgi:hypothetical protein
MPTINTFSHTADGSCCCGTPFPFCACSTGSYVTLYITFNDIGSCDCLVAGFPYPCTFFGLTPGPFANWGYSTFGCVTHPSCTNTNPQPQTVPGFSIIIDCGPSGIPGCAWIDVYVSWVDFHTDVFPPNCYTSQIAWTSNPTGGGACLPVNAYCSPVAVPVGPFFQNSFGALTPPCSGSYPMSATITV